MRGIPLVILATALTLAAMAGPAAAHEVSDQHEEDVLFVGHPLAEELGPSVGGGPDGEGSQIASRVSYSFHVHDDDHWVELSVTYDPGPRLAPFGCLRVTDLDLVLEGPDGTVRELQGCDPGRLTVTEQLLTPGDYTVTIHADQGATVCLPDADADDVDCTLPEIHYVYDLRIWDPDL